LDGAQDREYRARLGEVLRRRDPEALRRFLEESAARYGDAAQVADIRRRSADELEALLHRMILARPDLRDLHQLSQAWLASRGLAGPAPPGDRGRPSRRSERPQHPGPRHGPGRSGRRP
jgi:hypothetical protein